MGDVRGPTRRDWPLFGVALVVGLALKGHYSVASADELRWILAPTAAIVEAVTGAAFVAEAGSGYVSTELAYLIAPACAGVNFVVVVWWTGAFGLAWRLRRGRPRVFFMLSWLATAYVVALGTNAIRIVMGLELRDVALPWTTAEQLHRVEGVVVYVSALCVLWFAARATLGREPLAHAGT